MATIKSTTPAPTTLSVEQKAILLANVREPNGHFLGRFKKGVDVESIAELAGLSKNHIYSILSPTRDAWREDVYRLAIAQIRTYLSNMEEYIALMQSYSANVGRFTD